MEQILVKTEVQPNGEILLFYVDENAENDANNMMAIQNIPQVEEPIEQQEETYIYDDDDDSEDDIDISQLDEQQYSKEQWNDEETQRLLVFYMDNKDTFIKGAAKKKRLWSIACQTMITSKTPDSCVMKLEFMKKKYVKHHLDLRKGIEVSWPYYNLCQIAFGNDESVKSLISQGEKELQYRQISTVPPKSDGIIIVKQVSSRSPPDEKVEAMLKSFLKHKKRMQKEHFQRNLWETIASEIGDVKDAEYWQRRFINFKQHYIRLIETRALKGPDSIHWPYMGLFDQIFSDDVDFQKKHNNAGDKELTVIVNQNVNLNLNLQDKWNDTEITVLAKYFFDCFEDFRDPAIPNMFLWTEVSRLLDKQPNDCKEMYEKLKSSYFEQRLKETCDLKKRSTLVIIFDNIVAKETEIELVAMNSQPEKLQVWKTEEIDELVQFFCNKVEFFKDPIGYYVCWALVKRKLNKSLVCCKQQWEDLTNLYKSILNDKKEYPEMQIDWRYTELFDRIFDYGTDENLLDGYEKQKKDTLKTAQNTLADAVVTLQNGDSKQARGVGDAKVFKILEYYLKNKDKFIQTGKKLKLWESLSKSIGMSATDIDHRFRNMKQVYTSYIQREINKPEMPILWPYFNLCKKVFGYRAIKSKLKSSQQAADSEEWSAKEIKQLIDFVANNINVHAPAINVSQFSLVANKIDKTEICCYEKFIELRKSYRKLKTMKQRNAGVKVAWKYYNAFDQIFEKDGGPGMSTVNEGDINMIEGENFESLLSQMETVEGSTEDDYTIIVVPDGQDLSQAQILTADQFKNLKATQNKWNKQSKKSLLKEYIKYVKSHKTNLISREMWEHISTQLSGKKPIHCKKMFVKLKSNYIKSNEDERQKNIYRNLLEKVIKLKPKFAKKEQNSLTEDIACTDVELPPEKVEKALKYYLEHLKEFLSARYEKKYVWSELAELIQEPVSKVFNKIQYLKKEHSSDGRAPTEFDGLLQDIAAKENEYANFGENLPAPSTDIADDSPWTDDEIEQLLLWYFTNLEKFKNPKFVRKYLWIDASNFLERSPLSCSKKMIEIRTQYRSMVRDTPEQLTLWKFADLCQKIYGTGKKENLPFNCFQTAPSMDLS